MLGSFRLVVDDRTIPDRAWPRRAARSLLLLLLVTPGRRLPRDRVLDLLWPDATPGSAEQSLRKAVHALRRVLEPELRSGRASAWLKVGAESIALLDHAGLWIDTEAFEANLASARSAPAHATRSGLRDALALYGDDLLVDDAYTEWLDAPRDRLRVQYRRAVLDLAALDLQAGEPLATVPILERLLDQDATDEVALRTVMQSLAAAGRRDDAMRWFRRGRDTLRDQLDTEPEEETQRLADEIEALATAPVSLPLARIAIRPNARVPAPPNRLIGRVREIERLQDLLFTPDTRMVTLTGPGGVGKTRLAQEVARHVADDVDDGVCFVPLAPLGDHSLVSPAIARALGLPESGRLLVEETIQAALQHRELLLVLDNFEHVLDAAPQIATLLDGAAGLKVLVTSREPLQLRAEHEMALDALSVPRSPQPKSSRGMLRYESVQLFLHRAHAVWPSFVLTDDNAVTIAAICQRLDGLPLAIELAAAQVRAMSPEELLAGLSDRFALLAGGYRDLPARQQTLRDAIGWSHDVLSPPLQTLFRQLAVFAGSFTGDAAASVLAGTADSASIHEGIEALVVRSLLQRADESSGARYTMLESIREYGLELLAKAEEETLRASHAAWAMALADEAAPQLMESGAVVWLDRLEAELDNVRAALEWSLGRIETDTAIRLASELRRFWFVRGYLVEGRHWIERALAESQVTDLATRVKALFAAGELSFFLEDLTRARSCAEEGLTICRTLGDTRGMADALLGLGHIARQFGELDEAEAYLAEGIALARSTHDAWNLPLLEEALGTLRLHRGDLGGAEALFIRTLRAHQLAGNSRGEAAILSSLAEVARERGDTESAIALLEDSLVIVRRLRDAYAIAADLYSLGVVITHVGDYSRAEATLRESLTVSREHRLDANVAGVLRALASLATAMGNPERAARLYGAVEAFCDTVGVAYPDPSDDVIADGELTARAVLGDAAFAAARAQGRGWSTDQAVAEALADDAQAIDTTPPVRARATSRSIRR